MRASALQALLLVPALLTAAPPSTAQSPAPRPNGIFLIAKPELADPNFRRAVVLVTQTEDAQTIGVIINRPTRTRLPELLPDDPAAANYREPVYFGGPVMRRVLIAVFRSDTPPPASAFQARRGLYLSMHPDNLKTLLTAPRAQYRLYAGFSGWAPRQLEAELARDDWIVLPADADIVFRKDMEGVWEELLSRAQARKTTSPPGEAENKKPTWEAENKKPTWEAENKKPRMGAGLGARLHRAMPPERHTFMRLDAASWSVATCRLLECGSLIRALRTSCPKSRVCTIRLHAMRAPCNCQERSAFSFLRQ